MASVSNAGLFLSGSAFGSSHIRQREIFSHLVVSDRREKEPSMAVPLLPGALR
jgi:hypothetical protein